MEFATVNFFGNFLIQMIQKSSSSEADDGVLSFGGDFCWLVFLVNLVRLAGGAFFGVLFFSSAAAFFALAIDLFSLSAVMFSGDVKMALCIGLRPRFFPDFGGAGCNGPISLRMEAKLEDRESAIDVEGRDVEASLVDTSSLAPTSG